jgi:hypothetical protein
MRALVVYESMYGSTHVIADNIAYGLRADYEVTVVPVPEATPELVAAADLVVAGFLPAVWGALLQEGIDVAVILNALRALRPVATVVPLAPADAALTRRFRAEHQVIGETSSSCGPPPTRSPPTRSPRPPR